MRIVTISAVLALLALTLVGCASSGADKAAGTVAGAQNYVAGIQKSHGDIDRAVSMLKQISAVKGELKQQLQSYKDAVSNLAAQARRLESLRQSKISRREAYMAAWSNKNAEIKDDELRKVSEDRRNEALQAFEELAKDVADGDKMLDDFLVKLQDLASYLDVNLNASGIKAIASKVEGVEADVAPLKKKLTEISRELENLIDKMKDSGVTE